MITDVSSAGDTITIHGLGFAEAESTCTLTQNSSHGQLVGTIPAVKTFDPYGLQSSTQLTCSLPSGFGSFSAGAPVQVTLSGEDGEFVQMKPHVLSGDDSEHDTLDYVNGDGQYYRFTLSLTGNIYDGIYTTYTYYNTNQEYKCIDIEFEAGVY